MLSVYYDYQILRGQKFGGISRYFYELISRLPRLGAEVKVSCLRNVSYYFRESHGLHTLGSKNSQRLWSLVNQLYAKFQLRHNYDIIHPTYYNPYILGQFKGKLVVTVHDMVHEIYADSYSRNDKVTAPRKSRMIHAADRIIAISQNTKRDILRCYPDVDPAKISVIWHGSSMISPSGPRFRDYDYVLFVGQRGWYKNFSRFVEAMRPLLASHKELHVFCAGGGAFTKDELSSFGEFSARIHQASVSDEELARAYRDALCYVFPSEYEGFGIPILEAFACECPVVCADASSFPEVAGGAAEYFAPLDVEDMAAKIQKIIGDEALREKLRVKGRERLRLFNWNKTARETLECYKEALGIK